MKKFSKLFTLLMALMMFASLLGACGNAASSSSAAPASGSAGDSSGEPAGSGEALKVYVVSVMSGGAAWGQFERGFNQACEELGWEGHYLAPQAANSMSEMVNLCETAITNGADILVPVVLDNDPFADVLQKARDAGIVLVGAAAPDDNLDAYIGTDPVNLGIAVAEALVNSFEEGEAIKVVPMQTDLTSPMQNNQRASFEEHLMELRPDAVIMEAEECDSNAATAQDRLSALYLANPDLNSLVSFDSYAGLGGAAFVEEQGLQGEFKVVGIDDAPEILRAVQNGSMACTVAQMWYKMGYECMYLCKDVVEGNAYTFDNDSGSSVVYLDDIEAWCEENDIDINA